MKGLFQNRAAEILNSSFIWGMAVLLSSVSFWGCGSSANNEDPRLMPTFAPTVIVPDRDTIFMQEVLESKQDEKLEIEIIANQIIAGSAVRTEFNVDFSGSVIRYDDFSEGNFFGEGEEVDYKLETSRDNPNRVSVTITRTVPDSGVFGDGVLIVLRFQLVGIGASQLIFDNPKLFQQNGETLNFIQWFGGTAVVR